MQYVILLLTGVLLQVSQVGSGDSYLVQTAIANGGVGAILFVIWYFTFKYLQKQYQFALKQNQEQFTIAMKQNQEQFDKALLQIKEQHNDNLSEQRRVNDKLFALIQKDGEYKEVLTGVLVEIKSKLK
jgi:hypothetical protein